MRPRWLLAMLVVALVTGSAVAQEKTETPNTTADSAAERTLLPVDTLTLLPVARGEAGGRPQRESTAVLFSSAKPDLMAPASAPGSHSLNQSSTAVNSDKWEIILAPYLFVASINGDSTVGRGPTVTLDVNFGTILENFQFGGMGRFEVRKGRWGGMFEAAYLELGASIPTTGPIVGVERVVDAELEQTMLEGFLTYRALGSDKTSVDLFGGARYWDMDLDLEIRGPILSQSLTRGERWADPVFGVRVIHFVSDRWFIPVRGDLGGFGGAGATSDFTWNVQGGIGFQTNKHMAMVFQYKALGVDFNNGKTGSPDFFAFDAITHGPVLGMVLKF